MSNIIFAVIAAIAVIALGFALRALLLERVAHAWALSNIERVEDKLEKSESENEKLRYSNRVANKHNQDEQRRLRAEVRESQLHASSLQAFHLATEHELDKQLASTHGLIELLMCTYPKEYSITPVAHEVRRIFRPVVELDKANPNLARFDHSAIF